MIYRIGKNIVSVYHDFFKPRANKYSSRQISGSYLQSLASQ